MQVFLLSTNSEENAKFYMDKHIVKTPAVIVQILFNALARNHMKLPAIKTYHGMSLIPTLKCMNHPLTRWAASLPANFDFFLESGLDFCKEYRLRFHENHYLEDSILSFDLLEDGNPPAFDRYPWMIPMAFQNRTAGLVESYRRYYVEAKSHLAFWHPPRDVPSWYPLEAVIEGRKIAQSFQEAKLAGKIDDVSMDSSSIPN